MSLTSTSGVAPRPPQGIGATLTSTSVPTLLALLVTTMWAVPAAGMTWQGGVSGTSGAKDHIRTQLVLYIAPSC